MWQYIIASVTAFAVTFLFIPLSKPFACFIGLVDKPGGRKQHQGDIPLTGGISIFAGLLVNVFFSIDQSEFSRVLIVGGAMIVAVGAIDDRYDISPRFRLFAQLLIATLFAYGLEIKITHLGDLFGMGEIKLGMFSNVFTIISIIAFINALNMLDGMDGLVGTLTGISLIGLGTLLYGLGQLDLVAVCLCLTLSIFAFLIFNLFGSPGRRTMGKVFMGDAGSMFLGLMLAVLLVRAAQPREFGLPLSPVSVLWFVLLPVADMATTIFRRIKRGRSPLSPDRTHIHHILLRAGFTKYQVLAILGAIQLIMVCIAIVISLAHISDSFGCLLALLIIMLYQLMISRSWRIVRWTRRRLGISLG